MAARTFAQLNCSLLRSRKLRGLSHADRWAYICSHLTTQASFAGVFNYPKALWAIDAVLSQEQLEEAIERLVSAELIEWSDEDEMVRVVGVHRQRPPENASRVVGLLQDILDLIESVEVEAEDMVLRTLAELCMASVMRSQNWNPEKGEVEKLRVALGDFLRRVYQEFDDQLLGAIHAEMERSNKAAKAELGSLLPPLTLQKQDTLSTPSPHPADTRDVDETRRRRERDEYEEKDLDGAISEIPEAVAALSQAQPSEVLRKGEERRHGADVLPLEATKRSALAMGGG